jgi:anti-sigma regulatory factor (Ser/Thr protein kinase)
MKELALHILDVARNSVEAGASSLSIAVIEDWAADRLEIVFEDDGHGMSPDQLRQATDAFYTTRTTRRIGLGLPMLQATCERSGGGLEIASEPGRGTTVRCRLQLSNIDRPPLGDLGAALQALVCEPGLAFRYRHLVGGEAHGDSFELDTTELQHELGDVPLASPPVLDWLRGHVNQRLRDIGSRA